MDFPRNGSTKKKKDTKYKNISSCNGVGSELNTYFSETNEATLYPNIDLGTSYY